MVNDAAFRQCMGYYWQTHLMLEVFLDSIQGSSLLITNNTISLDLIIVADFQTFAKPILNVAKSEIAQTTNLQNWVSDYAIHNNLRVIYKKNLI